MRLASERIGKNVCCGQLMLANGIVSQDRAEALQLVGPFVKPLKKKQLLYRAKKGMEVAEGCSSNK